MNDDLTMGEIARTLTRLDEGQKEVLARIDLMRGEFVHRTEWTMRNGFVDERFRTLDTDITAIRTEANAKRAPWWALVTALTAVGALVLGLFQALG